MTELITSTEHFSSKSNLDLYFHIISVFHILTGLLYHLKVHLRIFHVCLLERMATHPTELLLVLLYPLQLLCFLPNLSGSLSYIRVLHTSVDFLSVWLLIWHIQSGEVVVIGNLRLFRFFHG